MSRRKVAIIKASIKNARDYGFDERLVKQKHVLKAIQVFLQQPPTNRPARSAFLIFEKEKLPAKHILKLAYREATGYLPRSEELTGGRASIRVLKNLGFDTMYDKSTVKGGRKNPEKCVRRAALKKELVRLFGPCFCESRFDAVKVPDFASRKTIAPGILRILEKVEQARNLKVRGRPGYKLAYDMYFPRVRLAVEYDERQHFTPLRAVSLANYPRNVRLGYDKQRWIKLSNSIRAGDNDRIYRDEQRALYDSIKDICASKAGLLPVVRIFEEDVKWERKDRDAKMAETILQMIANLVKCKRSKSC